MIVTGEQVRALRLSRHHLDRPLPSGALVEAAAGCGVQNSPPGAWETALWNRMEDGVIMTDTKLSICCGCFFRFCMPCFCIACEP